jgi:hypothetical protein
VVRKVINTKFMEKAINCEGRNCGETANQPKCRIYVAPKVLDVIPYEAVMAAAGSSTITGGVNDTKTEQGKDEDWAKEQDFFFTDESDEVFW